MKEYLGYCGKILDINLSSKETKDISTRDHAEKFLGGRGLAASIYWDAFTLGAKAFDAENRLIFATGPMAGLPVVGGSRWTVCGKSPATAPESFSYSNLGGHWGAALKMAGYDAVIVSGKSERPVFVELSNDAVKITGAESLWGKTTFETRELLKLSLGDSTHVVACGPAGENLVPFATILADDDASGSSGFGAVMGSKRLKAIAVMGNGRISPADPNEFSELCRHFQELKRDFETRRLERLSSDNMSGYASKLEKETCFGCIGACARLSYQADEGTIGKFACGSATFYGSLARHYYGSWNDVPFLATKLCDGYGLDTETIYCLMMWLKRCHEEGLFTDDDTGMPLSKMGSLEFIRSLVKKISYREGFGEILTRGARRAAEHFGKEAERLVTDFTSKDDRPMLYCPRMYLVDALLYAMEPRIPIQQLHETGTVLREWLRWVNKTKGSYLSSEVLLRISERFWGSELAADFSTYDGKALAAIKIQDRQYAKESLILCDWMWPIIFDRHSEAHLGDPTLESKLFSAVTGEKSDESELNRAGERVFNLQRAILVREGHNGRYDDRIPDSMFTVPLKLVIGNPECLAPGNGGTVISRKGAVVSREKFERMKDEYYRLRGWDPATGFQTSAKLRGLRMANIAEALAKLGLAK